MQHPLFAPLLDAAWKCREQAHVPFSGFKVGAALLAEDGRIFAGCNVEAANYSLTVCAERVALLKAISEGARGFKAIAVVAAAEKPTPPCGSCRQLLWELCGDITLILANGTGAQQAITLAELLPEPFGAQFFRP
ncbi:MAG: cytidine deaminase [Bryobacterales bacterium]|nr:cytidine deaminase [Bryobacterales bacterium]